MDLIANLKAVPEFEALPDSDIHWLIEKGTVSNFADGEKLFKKGDTIDELRIVLQGAVDMYVQQAGNNRYLGTFEKGEITGRLPYSRMKSAVAEGIVKGDTIVYSLHKDHFPELIREHHELASALVHVMTDRVRDFTQQQQQDDKMMALGKLSAGLAHELNNPSSAVVRSAQELKKHLSNLPEKFKRVIKIKTSDEVVEQVNKFVFAKISAGLQSSLSLMQKSAQEELIIDWLERNQVDKPYELAETFVDFLVTTDDLDELNALLRPEDTAAVIQWVSQVLTTERLVNEIEEASKRINALVPSVKSYTHMDRAPEKERADLRTGIRNTLTMLNHKIKKHKVTVVDELPDDLPHANIYISPLNQVWTNLIDNALDALEEQSNPILTVRAAKDREFVVVEIIDNGAGIPEEIQSKIFDSFFTTKPIGKGTGLGLEVVRQIVVRHHGKISVKSVPGNTVFTVCLPID